ncbi:MAG: DUF1416 domain-containing protein [Thermoplasmata archaeon]
MCALILALVAASLVPLVSASSSTPYTLYGYAYQPGIGTPVPAGVTVELTSAASGTVYTTTTAQGGQFVFSSASNAPGLAPGSWGVSIPAQTNLSLAGCGPYPCAVLPASSAPVYLYQTSANLTSGGSSGFVTVRNVTVLQYNATVSGTVTYQGAPAIGASVQLLDASRNNVVLASNVTRAGGSFSFPAPAGTWVLRTTLPGPTVRYNVTELTIAPFSTVTPAIAIQNYLLQGSLSVGSPGIAPNSPGNVTVFDPANGYIYRGTMTPSGFFSFGTYRNFTTFGSQPLDVFLSTGATTTAYFGATISANTPITRNVVAPAISSANQGLYTTTLNFRGFNATTGNGTLEVTTNATLGNDTVLPYLPNGSVGQLWSQLGLDFAHSLSLPTADLPAVLTWINSTGAFFPAAQAGAAINGTAFEPVSYAGGGQPLYQFAASTACSLAACGPLSSDPLNLSYAQAFVLTSSVATKSPAYTISFTIRHPTTHDLFTYNVLLPTGYVLRSGTSIPAGTSLTPTGPSGAWTSFRLTSYPSTSPSATVTLPILKAGAVTPIVNITASNFAFAASANVLNGTRANYTVAVGAGIPVTFSAQNSIFPAGTNATSYRWSFGNGNTSANLTSSITSYTYPAGSATAPFRGTLTILSSAGTTTTTGFTIWVVPPGLTAAHLSYNVTGSKVRSADGVPYLFLNWSESVTFNASGSSGNVSAPAVPGVLTVALFSVQANGYSRTQNNSVSQGTAFLTPFTTTFLGNGLYFNGTTINGVSITGFLGWRYYVNLTVWTGTGGYATTSLIVLVNDTQKPVAAFSLLNAKGQYIAPGGTVVEGANATAQVQLNAVNSTDPNNGSIVRYVWNITNAGNTTFRFTNITQIALPPAYRYPGRVSVWLPPQIGPYTVNLTVVDRAGNSAYTTQKLSVTINTTTRPIMAAGNLTGPSSVTQGRSYTYWVNVTVGGGAKAVARNITVAFYLLPPSGIGTRTVIVPSSAVQFFNYTNGVVNPTPAATGVYPALAYGKTVRAQITWSVPVGSLLSAGLTGSFNLYANISAQNEFAGSYVNGPQTAVMGISIAPNPTNQYIVYGIIAAVVVVLALLIFVWYRRRSRRSGRVGSASRTGLERGARRDAKQP